jgi:cytochrome b6-f complex iron-sulfur subunit
MTQHIEEATVENTSTGVGTGRMSRTEEKESVSMQVDKDRRGYLGINFLMFLRFFFPRALYEPSTIVDIGYPSDFKMGVNENFLQSNRIWVVKELDRLFVILARCTHLGCTPDWLPQQDMFHCPCHGSEYDPEGVNFAGPAPRPMDRCHVQLLANGSVQVDTSRLFIQDPNAGVNHFNDPSAYITV